MSHCSRPPADLRTSSFLPWSRLRYDVADLLSSLLPLVRQTAFAVVLWVVRARGREA